MAVPQTHYYGMPPGMLHLFTSATAAIALILAIALAVTLLAIRRRVHG